MSGTLYAYSLVPVLAVSTLLCAHAALYTRGARALVIYCGAVALWVASLLCAVLPATAEVARLLAASGAFAAAAYIHAAYEVAQRPVDRLVRGAYLVAGALTLLGVVWPGLLYDPVSLAAGVLFWPGMGLAAGALGLPLVVLWRTAAPERGALALSGLLGLGGAWFNAVSLAHGSLAPWGLYAMLASLLPLARVIRARQTLASQRILDRSLLYGAFAALGGAGFLLGVLALHGGAGLGVGALFVVAWAALAVEPLRQLLARRAGQAIAPERVDAEGLARALGEAEARADQAARLAELGKLTSAVAHEVRNPLGVIAAHLKILERSGAPPEVIEEMRAQIGRATHFAEDLLRYGRPRPLQVREVEPAPILELAWSTLEAGEAELVSKLPDGCLEADQAQLQQVLTVLLDNALQCGASTITASATWDEEAFELLIEDDGPGLPEALRDRLFEAFVTGRERGTGLGLAIARGIARRHGGELRAEDGAQGARFVLRLPRRQKTLAATGDA